MQTIFIIMVVIVFGLNVYVLRRLRKKLEALEDLANFQAEVFYQMCFLLDHKYGISSADMLKDVGDILGEDIETLEVNVDDKSFLC